MDIEEVFHLLADGVSLASHVREEVHQVIADHFAPEPAPDDPPAGA